MLELLTRQTSQPNLAPVPLEVSVFTRLTRLNSSQGLAFLIMIPLQKSFSPPSVSSLVIPSNESISEHDRLNV